MMRRIGTLMALALGALVGLAQTTSGEVSGKEVWSGEVQLTGDITIPFGSELTIAPGTEVFIATTDDTKSGLDINEIEIHVAGGTLRAVGSAESHVVFKTANVSPQSGQWYGIVCDLGEVEIRNASILHAIHAVRIIRPGFYEISDTEIWSYSNSGIRIEASGRYSFERIGINASRSAAYALYNSGASFLEIKGWHVKGGNNGLYFGTSETTVTDTTIESGSSYGLYIDAGKLTVSDTSITGRTTAIVDIGSNTDFTVQRTRLLNNSKGIDTRSVRAVVRDSQILGNGTGLQLKGDLSGNLVGGGNTFIIEGNVFEGNQGNALSILARTSGPSKNAVSKMARIAKNAFRVNGAGVSSDLSLPEGVLVGNDFVRNETEVREGGNPQDPVIIANGNYWGENITGLLDSGEPVSKINAFKGNIVVDDWASTTRLATIEPPPSPINWENNDWGVTVGETATIQLGLENGDSFDYQWFKDGVVIQGAKGPLLEIANASLEDAGTYLVIVSNEAGSVTSQPTILSVMAASLDAPVFVDGAFHPADTNQDSRISIDEVTSYGAAWKNGRDWAQGPNPIPIDYLTRAGAIWKNGERYRKDSGVDSAPLWWVNDSGAGRKRAVNMDTNASSGLTRRSLQPSAPSVSFQSEVQGNELAVRVVVPADAVNWAIEGDGFRFGPFWGNKERVVSLPNEAASSPLLLSVDGRSWIVGNSLTTHRGRLRILNSGGQLGLILEGGGAPQQLQSSTDLTHWSPVSPAGIRDGVVFPVQAEGTDQRFFRIEPGHEGH